MDNKKKSYGLDDNVERVSRLPEEYILAVEEIVDSFDKDWRNRIVYGQYINHLCDLFEPAIAAGKSVEEVVGSDRKAFAKKLEEELNFRNVEPTKQNKVVNYLIVFDFLLYIGLSTFNLGIANINKLETLDIVLLVIGVIFIVISFFMKLKKMKEINMKLTILPVEYIVSIVILFAMSNDIMAPAIAFLINIALDYVLASNHIKSNAQ